MSNYNFLEVSKIDSGIEVLTINRESKLNALNAEVLSELSTYFKSLNSKETRAVILTGAGEKSFIAGADITGMSEMDVEAGSVFSNHGQEVSLLIEEAVVPVIAAVNGYSLGGGLEMALSCDFILATSNAVFGLPEVSLGLIPGFGGTQRLARVIGRNRAKEMIYTGKKILAQDAKEIGLVLEVYENKSELMAASTKLLEKILRNSPYAVAQAKRVINEGVDLTVAEGLQKEKEVFATIFNSYDMKEGTTAFVEKRRPNFKGE